MSVYQLIYVSTPNENLKISEVQTIVCKAKFDNEKIYISGFLCANSKFFIQCLEGDEKVVKDLYGKILKDVRHNNIHLVGEREAAKCSFEHWGMGVVLRMERHFKILKKYMVGGEFNAYNLSYDECLNLLVAFSKIKS
ncbi:BLUF domain-containing protein [Colwellia sp. 12G3]|uniref:BLUF domain-containing protein n=1 Tax=Colwellia sp. 12G3 TaxID=2058299 RepID=UPI000C322335|nr:BLUF domain-containing protein [Colwellia sp. 12G3]PKI16508.1 hypothetical protein CXF71_09915 [Colwellia sp. 12G3]